MKRIAAALVLAAVALGSGVSGQTSKHTFALGTADFLLDGAPFQMIACEMHPARIPAEYWRHRIRMAKAMGCNTIAAYIFWNYHETGRRPCSISRPAIATSRGSSASRRRRACGCCCGPGPYVCAEWDFGGIPPYLLARSRT